MVGSGRHLAAWRSVLQNFTESEAAVVGSSMALDAGDVGVEQDAGCRLPGISECSGSYCRRFSWSGCCVVSLRPRDSVPAPASLPFQNIDGGIPELICSSVCPALHLLLDAVGNFFDSCSEHGLNACAHCRSALSSTW